MPLLHGRALADARAALADLSARFLRFRPSDARSGSLSRGLCGVALAQEALGEVFPASRHRARAEQAIACSLERIELERLGPGLYRGVAGVGWVTAHLVDCDVDGEDPCAPIDEALRSVLAPASWTAPYDLIDGLVGIGVYALERLPRPAGKSMLARIVGHLAMTAQRRSPGVTWWSDPAWVQPRWRQTPNPDWNLGVAHGVPGVIAFLGRVVAADVGATTRRKALELLHGAVAWLLAQELPADADGAFSFATGPQGPRAVARLAWCYGDPGVAAALLIAARGAGETAWEREAIRIGLRAVVRADATAGVVDACLCHGAAGLGHVFHRLYRATAEKRFAAASRAWFARALAMRASGRGFAGFLAELSDAKGGRSWKADPGYLTGAAGITLALVAATTDAELEWDRPLLLS